MPATRINEIERAYFIRKLGGTNLPSKPFNQIKREYIAAFVGGASGKISMSELETLWLRKIAADFGYTPEESTPGLWKQAVMSIAQVPSRFVEENRMIFFINAS